MTALTDTERAWVVACRVADGDYSLAQAGMDLARRRAGGVAARGERHDDNWGTGISFEEFIARSVRDAATIESAKVQVLWHLGWASGDANAQAAKSAYRDAVATASRILARLAANASPGDVVHHAILNVVRHFSRTTELPDIANPKKYAARAVENAALDLFRATRRCQGDAPIAQMPDTGPGPEMVAAAIPFFPRLRFDISCRLFGGVLPPLTAAFLLGMVSAMGEGARLESWPWPDPPMPALTDAPTDRLKYWVLRKILPSRFTPQEGAFSEAQRQDARQKLRVARSHLAQILRDTDLETDG